MTFKEKLELINKNYFEKDIDEKFFLIIWDDLIS